MAKSTWEWISRPLGIDSSSNNINQIASKWWNSKVNNAVHRMLVRISPSIVCWALWKARCSKIFSNKIISKVRISQHITFQAKIAIAKKFSRMDDLWGWYKVCNIAMSYKPRLTSALVKWNSQGNEVILNTDGSYMLGTGKAGAGGIVRRRNGGMIMVFANPIHFSTNNFSEANAALFGINWCCDHGMSNFKVEFDSMLIVKMIKGEINSPWNLLSMIDEIKDRVRERGLELLHCFREGNTVADTLAKHATGQNHNSIFLQKNQLPRMLEVL
ncbi:hypothetical protein RND71_028571 [Anisodus tanguticus]|uniref:RNase H type-1 domain-containing protein n=1 Tax=Anisodus tanguticus TaxID=243964 RepID=A0AAE1RJW9_9SOLA|nr:hypothetical protein RND71_028571 [Anisodus tanguticus]